MKKTTQQEYDHALLDRYEAIERLGESADNVVYYSAKLKANASLNRLADPQETILVFDPKAKVLYDLFSECALPHIEEDAEEESFDGYTQEEFDYNVLSQPQGSEQLMSQPCSDHAEEGAGTIVSQDHSPQKTRARSPLSGEPVDQRHTKKSKVADELMDDEHQGVVTAVKIEGQAKKRRVTQLSFFKERTPGPLVQFESSDAFVQACFCHSTQFA